jgi:RNA polymerase sigma-70 factor (ECF subfamily)
MDVQTHLKEIAKGDRNAFGYLFILYYPKVKFFITSLIKNPEDAEDISQEIFLKLWINRNLLPEIQHFSSYLFRMSKNAVFDYFKDNKRTEEFLPEDDSSLYLFPDKAILEDMIEVRDLEFIIDAYVRTMPAQQKNVFILSRKMGIKNEEIANKLNISKRTVEKHISNALKELRQYLSQIRILFF